MQDLIRRTFLGAGVALSMIVLDASAAMAQLVQSEVDTEPAAAETTQLVTSSTEVRRAVVGLIAVAVITAVLGVLYWYKTGQQARERHTSSYGGKHRSDTDSQRPRRDERQPLAPRTWSEPHPVVNGHAPPSPVPPSHRVPVPQPVTSDAAPPLQDSVYKQPVVWRED